MFVSCIKQDNNIPFKIFFDLYLQLYTENPSVDNILKIILNPIARVETPNDWINLESLGNITAVKSKTLVDLLFAKIDKTFDLALYIDELTSLDNLFFLKVLAQLCNLNLIIITKENTVLKNLLSDLSCQYVTCEDDLKNQFNKQQYDLLIECKRKINSWSIANIFDNDSTLLNHEQQLHYHINRAWQLLMAGAPTFACEYLKNNLSKASAENNSKHVEHLQLHLQVIRFHAHYYYDLVQHPYADKFEYLTSAEVEYIYYLKAYSATLIRKIDAARDSFNYCGINESNLLENELSLYRLNIYALFCVINNNKDIAEGIEIKIENYIKQYKIDSVGINYVNNINLARLYKYNKKYHTSLKYYENAYSTLLGAFTESDYLYYYMNIASVHEESDNYKDALLGWLSAAMHWIVTVNKYAIAWRPAKILSEKNADVYKYPVNLGHIQEFLFAKLYKLFTELEQSNIITQEITQGKSYDFEGLKQVNKIFSPNSYQLSIDSLNLIIDETIVNQKDEMGSWVTNKLEVLISHILNYYYKINNINDKSTSTVIYVDNTCFGSNNLIQNDDKLKFIMSIFNNTQYINSQGELQKYQDKIDLNALSKTIYLRVSKQVLSIKNISGVLQIKFKRFFLNTVIKNSSEISLLTLLENTKFSIYELLHNDLFKPSDILSLIHKSILSFEIAVIRPQTANDKKDSYHEIKEVI